MCRLDRAFAAAAIAAACAAHGIRAQQPPTEFVAFRFDDRHVIAVVGDDQPRGIKDPPPDLSAAPAAQHGFRYYDPDPAVLAKVPAAIAAAKRWIVHVAPGVSVAATAERVVAGLSSCTEGVGVLLTIDPRDEHLLASQKARYFVAVPAPDAVATATRSHVRVLGTSLPPDRRQAMESLLSDLIKRELPGVQKEAEPEIARFAESTASYQRSWARARRDVDAGLAAGRARLAYDIQGYQLEPGGVPLYFVRAEWRVGGRVGFGGALWVRGGASLEIVDQDLFPVRWVRMPEFQGQMQRELYGMVLNVLDRNGDGWGEVVMLKGGYEAIHIQLLERTPAGWSPTTASYSFGC